MEIGLGDAPQVIKTTIAGGVLILVLVEIGLGVQPLLIPSDSGCKGLNPCFSGNRFGS